VLSALLSRRIPDVRPERLDADAPAGFWEVATRPRLLRMMLVIALVGVAMGAVFIYHQPFARTRGIANVRTFFIAYAAVAVVIRLALGGVADAIGPHRVSIGALLLYVPAVTAMVWLQPGALAWLGAGLGIAHGFAYPALNAIAVGDVSDDERGRVMALFQAAFNVGFAVLSFALGLLAEAQGYPAVFVVGGVCALAALLVLVLSPEGRARR
jgi:predicted MFS family arabinose efflux permease